MKEEILKEMNKLKEKVSELEEIIQKMYDAYYDLDVDYLSQEDDKRFNSLYLKAFPILIKD